MTNDQNEVPSTGLEAQGNAKRPWVPMEIRDEGSVEHLVQSGGGKLSVAGGDPGEGRKPSGGG